MKQICLKRLAARFTATSAHGSLRTLPRSPQSLRCSRRGPSRAARQAGVIDEPLEKLNMERCRFVEDKDFWHTVTFKPGLDFAASASC